METVFADQLAWLTAWRIGRYANGSYTRQPFFRSAIENTPAEVEQGEAAFEAAKAKALKERAGGNSKAAGPPLYEGQIDQTQLGEAAAEFASDYRDEKRQQTSPKGYIFDVLARETVYWLNDDEERRDRHELVTQGDQYHRELFADHHGTPSRDRNRALLVELFDEQVHDSRAWFMHSALGTREIWAGYFFYRMIYFGNHSNRRLTPMMVAGKVIGVTMVAGAALYGVRRHLRNGVDGAVAGTLGGFGSAVLAVTLPGISYEIFDVSTGRTLGFVEGAAELLKPTQAIGEVAGALKAQFIRDDQAERLSRSDAYLRAAGVLVEWGQDKGAAVQPR
ncbi:hypothetical protein [Pseudomonas sp. NPDC007930]|uniref:T6SS phospholipase effector Tle1-like catalytic domain-containing protein n=1 Tax=Pseudomonas sp. NPDC007930 TaxID=3364417 RepID=UPI0036E4F1F6